jgi:D-lyxose ketol-isomerase
MILAGLNAGKTVYVATYLRCWKITAKTLAKWAAVGRELFAVKNDSLYMASGRGYDCIDYCAIKVI